MTPAPIPASVLDNLNNDDIDPKRVVAEIGAIVKSKRYAIYRIVKLNGIRVDLVESTLEPQIATFISDSLADENSPITKKLAAHFIPFGWSFADDPFVARRSANKTDPVWTDFAASLCHFFFRRSTAAETLVLVTQSPKTADSLDSKELLCCQGLTQVVFDEVVAGSRPRLEPTVRITTREGECLRWCAEGKTSEEIGIILSLSTHTVNHYLISATKKLNAVNRMHAITTAIRLGILDINSAL